MTRTLQVLLMCVLTTAGCDDPEADDGETSGSSDSAESSGGSTGADGFDSEAVVLRALAYQTDLVRINAEPRPTLHGQAATVNMFVDPEIAELYRSLDPAAQGPLVEFPDGSLIVKEHLDDAGVAAGYTLMAKGDPASESGGWWWARVDAGGVLRENGEVGFCVGCHTSVAAEGWVYGVPLDNRL